MRDLPGGDARNQFDALIVRTDFADNAAWREVVTLLTTKVDEWEPAVHLVDDSTWDGAGVDDVLAATAGKGLSVVFIADSATFRENHHALLAVNTLTREDYETDEDWKYMLDSGREFRTVPSGVHGIHTNLEMINMDFEEFSQAAHEDPAGVFRGYE